MDLAQLLSSGLDLSSALIGAALCTLITGLAAALKIQKLKADAAAEQLVLQQTLDQQMQKLQVLEQTTRDQQSQIQQLEAARQMRDDRLKQHEVIKARLEERLSGSLQALELKPQLEADLKSREEQLAERNRHFAELETRLEERTRRLQQVEQVLQEQLVKAEQNRLELAERNKLFAELETRLDAERAAHADKLKALEAARDQLKVEFQNLANRIFEEKSAKFSQANQEGLGTILNPLREQLGDFKKRVEDVYDKEAKDRRSLHEQISQLKQLNQQMSQDALNLTNALKGESKTQGNWGEVILERVLEESGLRRGHEYEIQVSLTEEGRRYQPDVIVRLPDQKDVIVDAKVSLTAYEQYCSIEDTNERARFLREHLQSLRNHIRGLSEKAYQGLEGVRSLDFVLLFVPIEGAFLLALENDEALFRDAFERNIMLVSPATLLVTLRTIHNIWRYEHQSQNAREIAKRGGELHDKFVGFVEAMDEIGRHLARSQQAYDTAHKRLVSGRGNLVNQAAMLNKLGASSKKKLDNTLVETAMENDPT